MARWGFAAWPKPVQEFPAIAELGGLIGNFPLVSNTPAAGLSHEMIVSWTSTWADNWPRFDGDVWSIQLTARPGYYVAPEILAANAGGSRMGGEWGA